MSIPFKKTLGVLISIFAANTVIAADFLTEGKIAAVEEDYKDGLMADDSEDLSLGKVEAAESMAALDLADQISKTIQKKYNQDSTDRIRLFIAAEKKVAVLKAMVDQNANGAFVALSAISKALELANEIDFLDQKMEINSSNEKTVYAIVDSLDDIISKANKRLDKMFVVGHVKMDQVAAVELQAKKLAALGLK